MEFIREDKKARIVVPDHPTVRQQLAYFSTAAVGFVTGIDFVSFWRGACEIRQDWDCELIPDMDKLDMDKVTDPKITDIVAWAGSKVREHMRSLEELPKNS
jgi:hypothetical protein